MMTRQEIKNAVLKFHRELATQPTFAYPLIAEGIIDVDIKELHVICDELVQEGKLKAAPGCKFLIDESGKDFYVRRYRLRN
jgi:hypothetical protein